MNRSIWFGTAALTLTLCAPAARADTVLTLPGGKTAVVPGFRIYIASGYSPSQRNLELLQSLKYKMTTPKLVVFDTTKYNKNMLLCRASYPVYGPNKTAFATLVESAINIELGAVGLATIDAPKIQATLDEFDFSSFGGGKWKVDATFTADGKPPVIVKNVHTYDVSAGAASGCADVMNALPVGIEAFLYKVYSEPAFQELFRE